MTNPTHDYLSQKLKLLSHPVRLQLLDALRREPECVCHLEALLAKPQPYVSQHLRLLREGGVIAAERHGQNLYYRLVDAEVGRWLTHILGEADGPHPDLLYYKTIVSCACPQCDTGLEISFVEENTTAEVIMSKIKILFLCTGNSARSQMAEALTSHHAGDRYEAYSAGLEPKGVNPYTVRVMAEKGISMDGHTSDHVNKYLGHVHFGQVVTVCDHAEQNCPRVWLAGSNHLHWGFDDPAAVAGSEEEILAKFREVRDQIEAKIVGGLK